MRDEPCDLCHSGGMVPDVEVALSGVLAVTAHRCRRCGFGQVRPRLGRADLDTLYPADYFDEGSDLGFRDYARQAQRNERAAYFLARRMRRLRAAGPVLEVGCALGFLLDPLRRFARVDVRGVDVSAFAAWFARDHFGLDVFAGTLEEAAYADGEFGFIVAKDLLEHVTHPRALLAETRRILRPGGHFWVITPNGEGNLRPLRDLASAAKKDGCDDLPVLTQGHLSFFSRAHVIRLLDEAGFDVVRFRNIGLQRGLRALGYLPRKHKTLPTIPRSDVRPVVAKAGPGGDPAERFERLGADLARAIEAGYSRVKSHPLYFHQRELFAALGTLPGPIALGVDFDVLARRR